MARERKGKELHTGIQVVPFAPADAAPPDATLRVLPGPLEVDLGCGKGRFLLARAKQHPGILYIGVDRMRRRLAKFNQRLTTQNLTNVRLVQGDILAVLTRLLPPASVTAFYVFFPDPWPKRRHQPRRLFSVLLLDGIHTALKPGGQLHVATDDHDYLAFIRRLFANDDRFQAVGPFEPTAEERTDFELLHARYRRAIGRYSYAKRKPA